MAPSVGKADNHPLITSDVVRPTFVEVSLPILRANYEAIRSYVSPAKMMPILKANGYGHGLVRVAQLMQELDADYIGVAFLEEGILLRQNGITMPILVLGGILGNQIPHFLDHDLTMTASSIGKLNQINEAAGHLGIMAKVHLKIDTGLERIGVHYYNAPSFLEAAERCPHLHVEGIFSHFANADAADLNDARRQFARFEEVVSFYDRHSIQPPGIKHMANSAALIRLPESRLDMVRPGLLSFGVYPSPAVPREIAVTPAMSWKSHVVYFKVVRAGDPVGYGSTWSSHKSFRAVTVPVGYGDGYIRAMSHTAEVGIHGKRYPVVGTISMDQIVVNIGSDSAYNNDEVILLGKRDGVCISCEEMAEWAGTVPYEILTNINTRVPRIYKE